MARLRWTLIAACLFAFPVAAATPSVADGDGGVSAFYTWSEAVPKKPGRLLRQEPLTGNTVLANAGQSVRILYSSTDGLDGVTPVTVSGALFVPKGAPPRGGWPLLAWGHGTVGVADVCAPSWQGRSQRDVTYLNHWLSQGYAIVASDYQGLGVPGGHPYLASRPAAYSILDSVRAVQGGQFGLSKKVVLIGQSQGGSAAFASAGYAPVYARELDIRGTVATGVPYYSQEGKAAIQAARPKDVVDATQGYTVLRMYLARLLDPYFKFEDYFSDAGLQVARTAASGCLGPINQAITGGQLTYNKIFRNDPATTISSLYDVMGYRTLKIPRPVFIGTGAKDHDVPPGAQLALVKDACAAGSVIESHLYPDFDHGGTVNGSVPDSTPFVKRAFAGEKIAGTCPRR
jgi:pimeloyl-ACP methyl ester carboxylesterase